MRIENANLALWNNFVEAAQEGVHLWLDAINELELDDQVDVLGLVLVCH